MIQQLPFEMALAQSGINYPWPNPRYNNAQTAFASRETPLTPPFAQTPSKQAFQKISYLRTYSIYGRVTPNNGTGIEDY